MDGRRIVVVGASAAGLRAAQALRRYGFDGTLTLVGQEPHLPYQRPPLSKQFLAGTWSHERMGLRLDPGLGVELRLATRARGLDLERRRVLVVANGDEDSLEFDGLVIATGASPVELERQRRLAGVFALRTLDDGYAMRTWLDRGPRVVVVGAGFVGAEVAATCRERGLEVTIVDPLPAPMLRVLGRKMGDIVGQLHQDHGIRLRLGRSVASLEGSRDIEGVRLDDGRVLRADMVVIGLGVRPDTDWLVRSGLTLDNGVVCDEYNMALGATDIAAAGDVARWPHRRYRKRHRIEHWTHAGAQGESAARALLRGRADVAPFDPLPFFWSDQYSTKLQMIGLPDPADQVELVEGDVSQRRFVAAYGSDGKVTGALVVGLPHRMNAWRKIVESRTRFPLDRTSVPAVG